MLIERSDDKLAARLAKNTALATAWADTKAVVEKTNHLSELWCRSRTPFSLTQITLTSGGMSPWKRLRQVSAELDGRRAALTEAKWGLLRLDAEIKKAQSLLAIEKDEDQKLLFEIEIGEKEERIELILNKFNGAMRDVRDLGVAYDELVAQIGEVSEDTAYAAELGAHLERATRQSVRDMRQNNTILNGNQEYLEQCGIDPLAMMEHIAGYLAKEKETPFEQRMTSRRLDAFITSTVSAALTTIKENGNG